MGIQENSTHRLTLAPAVLSDGRDLSEDAKAQIRSLMGARPGRFMRELATTWAVVALAIAGALYADHWLATIAAILVIGTRQMVLGLLMHEQVHRLGLRGRWADLFVNVTAVYPLLATTVEDYAEVHLRHHGHFMTQRDPDFVRKSGPEWTFPMPLARALKICVTDLLGLNTLKLIRGKKAPPGSEFKRPMPTPKWVRPVYYLLIAGAITWLQAWPVVLLYWVLPILTVTQLLVRWIAVLEHEYNHVGASVDEVTPLVRLNWWQRIVLPDLNFAMHAYHHNHGAVSFGNLPAVHEIYVREGKVDESAVFQGAGHYLRYLLGAPQLRPSAHQSLIHDEASSQGVARSKTI